MITAEQVRQLAEEKMEDDLFIVDVTVGAGNRIEVLVDRDSGLTIDDCKRISRHIEGSLDREAEDFSLEVSSPGVGKPLKVQRQYLKNVGRGVKVQLTDGEKIEGTMIAADQAGITVETKAKEEVPGKKGKKWVVRQRALPYSSIHETKIVISFK